MRIGILAIFMILMLTSPSLAIGRRLFSSNQHYYPQYYVLPQQVQERYVIPLREVKFKEVKGLQIVELPNGHQYYDIHGKLYPVVNGIKSAEAQYIQNRDKHKIII